MFLRDWIMLADRRRARLTHPWTTFLPHLCYFGRKCDVLGKRARFHVFIKPVYRRDVLAVESMMPGVR